VTRPDTDLIAALPRRRAELRTAATVWLGLAALMSAPVALASPPPPGAGGIYTCIDDRGRRLTADRPIPECAGREQQLLNRDGSLRRIVPPTLTAEEQAAHEARERRAAAQRAAQAEAVRRDRSLLTRYADEAAHQRAREAALDTLRTAMRATEQRLRDLAAERRPLENEAEFFAGRELPPALRARIGAVDAAVAAQREATLQQQAEMDRINGLFDVELERLRRLWAGAAPGSMGALPAPPSAPAPPGAAPRAGSPPSAIAARP
jgi:hypothetical protein